jgi:hypothetical protein
LKIKTSVVDPHHFDADQNLTYRPDADSDFLFDADPDPDPSFQKGSNPRKSAKIGS